MPNSRSNHADQGRQVGGLLIAVLAVAVAAAAQLPQPGSPVSLYLTVEKDDKLIGGLGPRNFRLQENGEARQFQLEKPETPASIALLVENSNASYYYWNDIQRALQGFVDNALEGHWYALATYSHDMRVDVDFTKEVGQIRQAAASLGQPEWDEIDTLDAVWGMLDKMGHLPGRKILVVIGSGFDSFSGHTLDDVQKKIESVNVVVYGVGAGSALRSYYEPYLGANARLNMLQGQSFLKMLADKSGGQAWFPMQEGAFPDVMKGIFQSLQFQYKMVYTSQAPADGKFHGIKVEAFTITNDRREDYKVRVREGWRF